MSVTPIPVPPANLQPVPANPGVAPDVDPVNTVGTARRRDPVYLDPVTGLPSDSAMTSILDNSQIMAQSGVVEPIWYWLPELISLAERLEPVTGVKVNDLLRWSGTEWEAAPKVFVGPSPPTDPPPLQGDFWFDNDDTDAQLYVYFNDGTSVQWVPTTPQKRLNADDIAYDDTGTQLPADEVQTAIEVLDKRLDDLETLVSDNYVAAVIGVTQTGQLTSGVPYQLANYDEAADPGDLFDPVTGVYTAAVAGLYHVDFAVQFGNLSNSFDELYARVLVNGSPAILRQQSLRNQNVTTWPHGVSGPVNLGVGDTIAIELQADGSSAGTILGGTAPGFTFLEIVPAVRA